MTTTTPGGSVVVVMGVSASGKSTVAVALARRSGAHYLDADDFHPARNVAKMHAGVPLTDQDRRPWLDRIRHELDAVTAGGEDVVLACSALKQRYRAVLRTTSAPLRLVYLRATHDELACRITARTRHFFPAALLQSQFAALEEPTEAERAVVVSAILPPWSILDRISGALPDTRPCARTGSKHPPP
ncbi:MAG: gluconokinase [Sciscionella sp.]